MQLKCHEAFFSPVAQVFNFTSVPNHERPNYRVQSINHCVVETTTNIDETIPNTNVARLWKTLSWLSVNKISTNASINSNLPRNRRDTIEYSGTIGSWWNLHVNTKRPRKRQHRKFKVQDAVNICWRKAKSAICNWWRTTFSKRHENMFFLWEIQLPLLNVQTFAREIRFFFRGSMD